MNYAVLKGNPVLDCLYTQSGISVFNYVVEEKENEKRKHLYTYL